MKQVPPSSDPTSVAPVEQTPPPRLRRRVAGALALTLIAAASLVGGITWSKLSSISKSGGGSVSGLVGSMIDPKGKFPGRDRVNIVLIGKDYNRLESRDPKLNGMPFTKGSRADSIVVLSLDMNAGKVSALSVPRDTLIQREDGEGAGKINGTYARGGAKQLQATLGDLLGVTPEYYVALKPDGVKNLVDKLGGVDVEAIDDMNYDDNWGQLHIHLKKGPQRIDGAQAVGFTRFREVKRGTPRSKEEGDGRRMARQQMVIKAMATEAKKPGNWLQVDSVINYGLEQIETNLSREQVFALGALFRNIQPEQMQTASLTGKGTTRGTYFFVPDDRKKKALVDWLLKGDESAANRLTVVAVQNGTEVPGLARRVADLLREQGFDAKSMGNAKRGGTAPEVTETRIVYGKAAVQVRAERIAKMLGGGKLEKQVSSTGSAAPAATADPEAPDVTIVLGRDLAATFAERSARL
ncbi:MAG: LCP family protein [Cytophagales bacterium]|nr:LCP family protein [Armatimonadota bacterium]